MMKNRLIALSIFAGCAASVPVIYQINPDRFHAMLDRPADPVPVVAEANLVSARMPQQPPKQATGRRVAVSMDPSGHFVAEFKLNGRRVEAMVDTGATLVAINRSTARRIGIALKSEDFKYRVNTANGPVAAASARIDALQIGRIHVENVDAVVLDDRSLNNTLVGMSFLNRLAKYRVEGGALLLEQ